ncbi:MAG: HEAT repeat domain-containing protein [Halobacteriota archaeon]|nr:HEAT repeat domain-containing protein [Halobacteriota archaeon]MDY6958551.1 HEAT repeat domain-containing protein [Halobacteriota archaeon]
MNGKTKKQLDKVRKMGEQRDIAGLLDNLKDERDIIRLEAVQCLYRICDEGTVDSMINMLKDSNSMIREYALLTLINIGGEDVIGALISALDDTSDRIRDYAADALGEIGDERALEPLEKLFSKGYNKIAREAYLKIKYDN